MDPLRRSPRLLAAVIAALLLGQALAQAVTPSVQVRYDAQLGHVLTDAAGMTLYVYGNDEPGVSNCVDACATNWPPVIVATEAVLTSPLAIPGEFGTTARADGALQLTYGGWPLYGWVRDAAPGETTGQAVGGVWWVANLAPIVQVASHPTLGDVLVGPTGMTLYTFANDTEGVSNCAGGCAANWPPLVGGFDPAGMLPQAGDGAAGALTTLAREDGGIQVAYGGVPLYYWRNDKLPGQATGDGVGGNWLVARP
jgi:predicted lipoprotein with Yx(FWY)xxD motif